MPLLRFAPIAPIGWYTPLASDETSRPHHANWVGPACGLASAFLYTLANVALRYSVEVDAYVVSAVKAVPTVLLLGPLLSWQWIGGRSIVHTEPSAPRRGLLMRFLVASFLAQFFGNVAFQKALEHIGLAASVPITLGVLIVGGAILGAVLLGEPVGTRKVMAIITLILAVFVLAIPSSAPSSESATQPGSASSPSAEDAQRSPNRGDALPNDAKRPAALTTALTVAATGAAAESPPTRSARDLVVGSLWAAISGLAYSFFGVTMRRTLHEGYRSGFLMLLSGLTGTLTLWPFCVVMLGSETLLQIPLPQWTTMFAAGVFNFLAFIAITASLRLLPVVAVNLINASQVAMAAVAGVILFSEPVTPTLIAGILLTIVGLVILARRTRAPIVMTD